MVNTPLTPAERRLLRLCRRSDPNTVTLDRGELAVAAALAARGLVQTRKTFGGKRQGAKITEAGRNWR